MKIHSRGNVIGYREGHPVLEWITYESADGNLTRFTFDRLAFGGNEDGFPLHQLKEGEFLIVPGAIYK